jgi:Na+/phosphate symporter
MVEWFADQPAEVKVAIVGMIGAVVVAFIQHLKGKPSKPAAEIAGAIVDNKAIDRLADAVEDLTKELRSIKGATSRMTDQVDRAVKDLGEEVRKVHEEMLVGRRRD